LFDLIQPGFPGLLDVNFIFLSAWFGSSCLDVGGRPKSDLLTLEDEDSTFLLTVWMRIHCKAESCPRKKRSLQNWEDMKTVNSECRIYYYYYYYIILVCETLSECRVIKILVGRLLKLPKNKHQT
jgi:hypothetical protein